MFQLKNKSTLARNSFKTLSSKPSNNFNDLLKQPIHSYTQNSFINLDIAALTQAKYGLDISWTASLIVCSGGLRILLSGSNYLISVFPLIYSFSFYIFRNSKINILMIKVGSAKSEKNGSLMISPMKYLFTNWIKVKLKK